LKAQLIAQPLQTQALVAGRADEIRLPDALNRAHAARAGVKQTCHLIGVKRPQLPHRVPPCPD
jgi:hypothetical protein